MTAAQAPLFEANNLQKWYSVQEGSRIPFFTRQQKYLRAVDDVSFEIADGEIVGLAGQSGCGKSTLGELLVRLQRPTGGEIRFRGENIESFDKDRRKKFRQECQIIFQDPYESLNPRFTVARIISEPLHIHGIGTREERAARVKRALVDAGLEPPEKYLDRLPNELSGGERQRVSIARALALEPAFLVADEPVSMLDVSVSTSILKLFKNLQETRDLSILYISHDLSTINSLTERTMIMYLGDIVEVGPTEKVLHDPAHPYTESLLSAVPGSKTPAIDSDIEGEVPDPIDLPTGCRYRPNCQYATEICAETEPELEPIEDTRTAACHHPVTEPED